jgi:hypothetical protein
MKTKMPHHDVKITVEVIDTVTGERATDATHSTWDRTEGKLKEVQDEELSLGYHNAN